MFLMKVEFNRFPCIIVLILVNLSVEKGEVLIPLGQEHTTITFRVALWLELEVVESGFSPLAAG